MSLHARKRSAVAGAIVLLIGVLFYDLGVAVAADPFLAHSDKLPRPGVFHFAYDCESGFWLTLWGEELWHTRWGVPRRLKMRLLGLAATVALAVGSLCVVRRQARRRLEATEACLP